MKFFVLFSEREHDVPLPEPHDLIGAELEDEDEDEILRDRAARRSPALRAEEIKAEKVTEPEPEVSMDSEPTSADSEPMAELPDIPPFEDSISEFEETSVEGGSSAKSQSPLLTPKRENDMDVDDVKVVYTGKKP